MDVEGGEEGIEENKKEKVKDQSQLEGVSISNSKPVPGCSLCGWQSVR